MTSMLSVSPDLVVAQQLDQNKPVHSVIELAATAGSVTTARRYMRKLEDLGFAQKLARGHFTLRSSVFQPYSLWSRLLPSLEALKKARYFGRSYNESDVHFVRKRFQNGIVTLDYRAYELTRLQTPERFFLYVANPDLIADELRREGFSEGKNGRVAILPGMIGSFQNEIQRVYLDCLAAGGRGLLDAVAIELLYAEKLETKGMFPVDLVERVREDLNNITTTPVVNIESAHRGSQDFKRT